MCVLRGVSFFVCSSPAPLFQIVLVTANLIDAASFIDPGALCLFLTLLYLAVHSLLLHGSICPSYRPRVATFWSGWVWEELKLTLACFLPLLV